MLRTYASVVNKKRSADPRTEETLPAEAAESDHQRAQTCLQNEAVRDTSGA